MLSLHALRSAGAGGAGAVEIVKYVTEGEYYSEDAKVTGVWHGEGLADFGLVAGGDVDLEHFTAMLRGYDKDGNIFTRAAPQENHTCGLDMTFSSPKSVSLLRAAANDTERVEIDKIIFEARTAALDYAVKQGAFVIRKGKGGCIEEPARPVFAMFSHHHSRAKDPDEHFHVIAVNAAKDAEGKGYRIEMAGVWRRKMELGAVMRAFEACALQRAGYTIERDRFSYRVAGLFSKEVERHFSKWTQKIDELAGAGASSRARGAAALKVRSDKTPEEIEAADRRCKDEFFAASGIDGDMIAASKGQAIELTSEAAKPRFDITEIIDRLSEQSVYFRESDLRAEIAVAAQGVYDVEIESQIKRALSSDRLVPLYSAAEVEGPWMTQQGGLAALSDKHRKVAERSYEQWSRDNPAAAAKHDLADYVSYVQEQWLTDHKDQVEAAKKPQQLGWTTRETLMADIELARYAKTASQSHTHAIDKGIVDKAVAEFEADKQKEIPGFAISAQQRAAIYHMTTEGDLAQVEGVAGAGKSTFLFPVARAYEAAGYKVIGLSFQNTNASDLATDAKIDTYTIDKFVGITKPGPRRPGEEHFDIDAKTIIILDEAGQVGGMQMHQVQRIVEAAGAKLALSGHTAQKQAISGTAAMKLMREAAGEGGSAWITETQRQRDKAHGEALTKLSDGDAVDALVKHAENGRFHIVDGEGFAPAAAAYHRHVEKLASIKHLS